MALSLVGSLSANSATRTGGNPATLATNADLPAGAAAILFVATDNISTASGNTNDHTSASLSGHAMSKVYEWTYSPTGVAADAGTISVWVWKNDTGSTILSGSSFTINFSSTPAAQALHAERLDSAVGSTLAWAGAVGNSKVSGANYPPITIDQGVSREALWLRAIAQEVINSGTFTTTPGPPAWTAFPLVGVSGGSSTTAIAFRGEYLVASSQTETTNPGGNLNDAASISVAIYEVAGGGPNIVTSAAVALSGDGSSSGVGGVKIGAPAVALSGDGSSSGVGRLILSGPSVTSDAGSGLAGAGATLVAAPPVASSGDGAVSGAGALITAAATTGLSGESLAAGAGGVRIAGAGGAMDGGSDAVGAGRAILAGGAGSSGDGSFLGAGEVIILTGLDGGSDFEGAGILIRAGAPVLSAGDASMAGAGATVIQGAGGAFDAASASSGAGSAVYSSGADLAADSDFEGAGSAGPPHIDFLPLHQGRAVAAAAGRVVRAAAGRVAQILTGRPVR